MAGNTYTRFIFKLCVIMLASFLNDNNNVRNKMLVVAQILVEPLWDNSSQCFVDTTAPREIQFEGSVIETCSLQVMSPKPTYLQIQIQGRDGTQKHSFLYIERDEDLDNY